MALVITAALFGPRLFRSTSSSAFTDEFRSVQGDSFVAQGWAVLHKDSAAWSKRGEHRGTLTLYTLQGDNWPDSIMAPEVKNLLVRRVDDRCFAAEARLVDFVPRRNWEQAGILLMEDTTFTKPCVRLSIAYNDYTGGFPGPREILIQAITCTGSISEKPVEVVHKTIFTLDPGTESLVESNLKYSALRIEKEGDELRFLYSASAMENAAFKEVGRHSIGFSPRYVGLFALKGFVADSAVIPARFSYFSIVPVACRK